MKLIKKLRKFLTGKEEGASLAEYGLLIALIAVICVGAIGALGGGVKEVFNSIATTISNAAG